MGKGGAHIADIQRDLPRAISNQPDTVVIQVGGNDFSGGTTPDHLGVAPALAALATRIISLGTKRVYICKLFLRFKSKYLPTTEAVKRYNTKVQTVNQELTNLKPSLKDKNIYVWAHKGGQQFAAEYIGDDGTHLSEWGKKKYLSSMRGTLIQSAKAFTSSHVKK